MSRRKKRTPPGPAVVDYFAELRKAFPDDASEYADAAGRAFVDALADVTITTSVDRSGERFDGAGLRRASPPVTYFNGYESVITVQGSDGMPRPNRAERRRRAKLTRRGLACKGLGCRSTGAYLAGPGGPFCGEACRSDRARHRA